MPVTFADLGLPAPLLEALDDAGFSTPTDIQAQAIEPLSSGRDVIGVAQTGTGKTAAFGLAMLARLEDRPGLQGLVLAPTRELALQGADAIGSLATHLDVEIAAVYGGAPYGPQIGAIKSGAQIVVGTPGRIMDLIDKGILDLSTVRFVVLDEADEMLRMGFADDVEEIASHLPSERVTALFSATMPKAITRIAKAYLNDPLSLSVTASGTTVDTVDQTYAVVPNRHKMGALARVLAVTKADAAIVFVRTRASAEDLALELGARGVQAAALSGDVAQNEREKLVDRLRTGFLDVLVATDVAARGLDVDRIGLVVNYDVPREVDTYVHRIGRTGRAGRSGTALTFIGPKDRHRLRRIEKATGVRLEEVELPSAAEVSKIRAAGLLTKAKERYEVGRLGVYEALLAELDERRDQGEDELTNEQLLLALLALGVRDPGPQPDDFEPKREDRDKRRMTDRQGRPRGRERSGRSSGPSRRYRIEVGKRDGVGPGAIVGAMTNEGGLRGSDLGRIDIFPSFSLVEVFPELSQDSTNKIAHAKVAGRALRIRPDEGGRGSKRFR